MTNCYFSFLHMITLLRCFSIVHFAHDLIPMQQKNTLEDEEKTDQNLRQQFGERWVRQPSSKLNEQWKQEIAKMFKFLEEVSLTICSSPPLGVF